MADSSIRPDTINKLRFGADAAFAMLAGMQLDVFTPMKDGPMTAEQIADAISVKADRLRLLLWSLVAAGLLTEKDKRYSNTNEANHFLVKGNSSYMGNLQTLFSNRWVENLPKTADSIRTGTTQLKKDFYSSPADELEAFLRRINLLTIKAAQDLLANYDFSTTQTLADVGCGGAGIALTMARACSAMHATAIDLPQVTPITQKLIEESGVTDRVSVVTWDVLSEPLPGVFDAVVLRALLQVLSADDARLAVKNISAAIKPSGRVFIIAQILDDSRTAPLDAVGFNLLCINSFDVGEAYTEQEHRNWLSQAGFVEIERASFLLADGHGLMTARKPG